MLKYELHILEQITGHITGEELLILPAEALSFFLSVELLRLQACFRPGEAADMPLFNAYLRYHHRCILHIINLLESCNSVYRIPLLQCFRQLQEELESGFPDLADPSPSAL